MVDSSIMKTLIILLLTVSANSFAKEWRFQISGDGDLFSKVMIDTQTGKLWKYRCSATVGEKCLNYAWVEEIVEGVTMPSKDFQVWMKKMEDAEAKN